MSLDAAASNHAGHHQPGAGYWIAPTGHVLRVASRHIVEVCQRPEVFGFSVSDLKAIFESHDEAWASEQNAREEIIRALVARGGWIRVRHYVRQPAYWSFNLPGLTANYIDMVGAFFCLLGVGVGADDRVRLDAKEGQMWSTIRALMEQNLVPTVRLAWAANLDALPRAPNLIDVRVCPLESKGRARSREYHDDTAQGGAEQDE
jgi:hypothetical protein